MASYPTSRRTYTAKVPAQKVASAHINELDDEVYAMEDQLITSKLASLAAAPVGAQVLTSVAGVPTWVDKTGLVIDIHGQTAKTTPVDADETTIADSAAAFVPKKLTWANLKAALKTALASATPTASTIPIADAGGKLAVGWMPASATPTASTIPIADGAGKLAVGWIPAVPYKFSVWRNAAANSGNGAFAAIAFDTEIFDTGNNVSAGVFTAPVTGFYKFDARAGTDNVSAALVLVSLFVDGSENIRGNASGVAGAKGAVCGALISLTAGQMVDVRVYGASAYALEVGGRLACYFTGFLVSV